MKKKHTRKIWTPAEIEIVKNLFPNNYTKYICELLNRSYQSISSQACLLNLKKSDEFKHKSK